MASIGLSLAGQAGGAYVGSIIGGEIGSIIPGVGTSIGAAIGAGIGQAVGGAIGAAGGAYIDATILFPAIFGRPTQLRGQQLYDIPMTTASLGSPMNFCMGRQNRL